MKLFLFLLTFFTIFLSSSLKVYADENFDISASTTYTVSKNAPTKVLQKISILNKKEFIFSPDYSISFGFKDVGKIQVYNTNGSIPFDYKKDNDVVNLTISFVDPPKGIDTTNNFTVSFETNEIVEKKGGIYEVDIPGISNPSDFLKYDTQIIIPSDFPEISILKPDLKGKRENLKFSKEDTRGAGIVLIFGDSQFYSLDLIYHISNPNLFPITTEIALPPNTNYQKSLIEDLSEIPNSVKIDSDGNWLYEYTLLPREKKTIKAKVKIQTYSSYGKVEISEGDIDKYTKSDKYWEANDSKIKKIASGLKTPEKIYEYVVDKLSYDFTKISSGDERLGGKGVLNNTTNAVCLEYSDLFIALARSAGIPSRSIEGFAYTRNSSLRPLSLVDDVLHAWVEYYDFEKKAWIMIDPTWGSTTGGIDYFKNLDLDHIAFVIKGRESEYPIPAGGYKFKNASKDVNVKFINEEEFIEERTLEITNSFPKFSLAGIPISGFVNITNSGNTLISNELVTVINNATGEVEEYKIESLAPYETESFVVTLSTSFLTNSTHEIKIQINNTEETVRVKVSFIPNLNLILIGGGILVASAVISILAFKTWRIYIQRRKK